MHRFVCSLLLCLFLVTVVSADPRVWEPAGVSVRESYNIAWERVIVRRDNGDHLVIWSDTRTGNRDVYGQYINADGLPLWNAAGTQLVRMDGLQQQPHACWSADYFYLCWVDFDYATSQLHLWLQKYDLAGNHIWQFNNGLGLRLAPIYMFADPRVAIAPDGAGGVYVGRLESGMPPAQLAVQRVGADGTLAWAQEVIVADTLGYEGSNRNLIMTGDPGGQLFLTWSTARRAADINIYAALLTPQGTLPWGQGRNGIAVCQAARNQVEPQLCLDGNGGCFVAWLDERTGYQKDLYAQHITAAGTPAWSAEGVVVSAAPHARRYFMISPSFVNGTMDGLLAAWEDERVNGFSDEIFAQKLSLDGTALWTANGVHVCGNAEEQTGDYMTRPRVLSDYEGGALLAWDRAFTEYSRYVNQPLAARLDGNGNLIWGANCGHALDEPGLRHTRPVLSYDFRGDPIYFWITAHAGNYEINVQRLDWSSGAPLIRPDQQTFFSGIYGNPWSPKVYALGGGNVAMFWDDDRNPVANGRLFYQIITPTGQRLLERDGRSFLGSESTQPYYNEIAFATDRTGGGFVCWQGVPNTNAEIRVQHMLPDGGRAFPDSGLAVWPTSEQWLDQQSPLCVSDGSGGCYVAWGQYDALYYYGTAVMHLAADGRRLWNEPRHFRPTGEYDVTLLDFVRLSSGNLAVLMFDGTFEHRRIFVTALNPDGVVQWSTTVMDSASNPSNAKLAADLEGGTYVAWPQRLEQGNTVMRAQRISATGALLWPDSGAAAIRADQWRTLVFAGTTPSGSLWLGSLDGRVDEDLYVQRVRPNGTNVFADSGLALVTEGVYIHSLTYISDGLNGLMAVWSSVFGEEELQQALFIKHVDSSGVAVDEYYDGNNGGFLGGQGSYGPNFGIAQDDAGGAIVAWVEGNMKEEGSDDYFDVFRLQAQRIVDGHILKSPEPKSTPASFALAQNYPNPFNPTTDISYSLPATTRAELTVYDITGRKVAELFNNTQTAGTHTVHFDAHALSSGLYFYRLSAGDYFSTKKMVLLK